MNKKITIITGIVLGLFIIVVVIANIGFYTVQPIGALPEGVTLVVWRNKGEPFFNSPDALSIRVSGGVSLFSRAMALKYAPMDRIILKLPYLQFAYLQSTDGIKFDR